MTTPKHKNGGTRKTYEVIENPDMAFINRGKTLQPGEKVKLTDAQAERAREQKLIK